MAGETYGVPVPPSGSAFAAGQAARASQMEAVRQSLTILGKRRYWDLGSASEVGHVNTSYEWAANAGTIKLCAEDVRGLTLTFRVWVYVANASGTVRVRLRNTTDSSDVAVMAAAVSDTSWTLYEVAATAPTGTTAKTCRVEIIAGSALYPAYYRGAQLEIAL
jgi:hypothetical protein